MTSFSLKIIALISMFLDHLSYPLYGGYSFLNLIGRIAFPIFAFQISEGFTHTKNIKKYFFRLGLFAIISQIPFGLFHHKFISANSIALNVFFTLFLGLLCIWIYEKLTNNFNVSSNENKKHMLNSNNTFSIINIIGILIVCLIAYIAEILNTDYGFWGVLVLFTFYLFKNKKFATIASFCILCIIKYAYRLIVYGFNMPTFLLGIFTIFPIIFIGLYNGKQGKKIKYFLYLFYPVHLLLLYFI